MEKIFKFLRDNRVILVILVCAGIFAYFQSSSNAIERRLLERNFDILQSSIKDLAGEQRDLKELNGQLIVHATKLDGELAKYGQQIDELARINQEDRRILDAIRGQLSVIGTDISATKTELSASIVGLKGDIDAIRKIQSVNTANGDIYDELERRLRELAERYGVDIDP